MPNSPRDFRGWQTMVERKLRENARQGTQVTAYAVKQAVTEADKALEATMDLTPAAPVELSWQTAIYREEGTGFRPRVKVVLDFPEVVHATDGTTIVPGGYELWAREETKSALVNTIAPWPGSTYAGLSFPGQEPYVGEGIGEWERIATSSRPGFNTGAFRLDSTWRFRVRAIGATTVKPGVWSEEHVIIMAGDTVPPAQPRKPSVTAKLGTLIVKCLPGSVSGAWPGDLDFIRLVHGNNPAPTVEIHRFSRRGGTFILTDIPYYEPQFFRLQAVDDSGNESPWSEQEVGIVVPLVDTTEMKARLEATNAAIEQARAETAESGIELGERLEAAESDLSAAAGRLTDAETAINTTIPTSITTAKNAAITAAASDATGKADAAKAAADAAAAAMVAGKGKVWRQTAAPAAGTNYAWLGTVNASQSVQKLDAAEQRRNLAHDPGARRGVNAPVPTNLAGWTARWYGPTPGAGTTTWRTGQADGPIPELTTYLRKTWTVAPPSNGDTGFDNTGSNAGGASGIISTGGLPVIAGTTYTISSYLRSSAAGKRGTIQTVWRTSAGAYISSTSAVYTALTQGKWVRLSYTVTAPATAAYLGLMTDVDTQTGDTNWAPGDVLDGTGLLIEASSTLGAYFDGDSRSDRANDLWIDTSLDAASKAKNLPMVWNGTGWAASQDQGILDALANAATAQAAADAALSAAGDAQDTADGALASANGKTKVYRSLAAPSGTGTTIGDVWWQYADNTYRVVIGEWSWDGDSWEVQTKSHQTIASVDVGSLTVVGTAVLNDVVAQHIAAKSGQFLSLDVGQLTATGTSTLATAVIDNLWTKVVRSRSITTDMLVVGRGENLIPWKVKDSTPSVEPHLRYSAATTLSIDTTQGHSGKNSMALANPTLTAGTYTSLVQLKSGYNAANGGSGHWNVAPAEQYVVEVWVRASGTYATTPSVRLSVNYTDASAVWVSSASSAAVAVSATWQKLSIGVTVPAGISSMYLYVQSNQPGTVLIDDPFMKPKISASMVVDGGIMAQHIDASESMNAKLATFLTVKADMIESNAVTADKINAGAVTGTKISATAIDGKTITGGKMVGGSFKLNSGNYTVTMYEDVAGPLISFDTPTSSTPGTIRAESDGDMVIRSAATASRPNRQYITLKSAAAGVIGAIETDAHLKLLNSGQGIYLPPASFVNGSGAVTIDADATLYLSGTNLSVDVDSGGYVRLVGNTNAASAWVSYLGNAKDGVVTGLRTGSNGTTYFQSDPVYTLTGTAAANVTIRSDGYMQRSTSASRYKLSQRVMPEKDEAILSLAAMLWYDKGESEATADYYTRLYNDEPVIGPDGRDLTMAPPVLREIPGMIAEHVEAAGLQEFVIYGPDGQVEGIMYDRLAVALIPVIRRLRDRIAALEWETTTLRQDLANRTQRLSLAEGTINTLSNAIAQLRLDFTNHVKATTTTTTPTPTKTV